MSNNLEKLISIVKIYQNQLRQISKRTYSFWQIFINYGNCWFSEAANLNNQGKTSFMASWKSANLKENKISAKFYTFGLKINNFWNFQKKLDLHKIITMKIRLFKMSLTNFIRNLSFYTALENSSFSPTKF